MMEVWLVGAAIAIFAAAALVWMWRRVKALPVQVFPADHDPIAAVAVLPPTANITREKVDANLRRFTLAVEQNTKGKARDTELRRNLDYWKTIDIALRSKGE
jgi:hypothetical protein